jgi:predicted O-methyltransferase YrrM
MTDLPADTQAIHKKLMALHGFAAAVNTHSGLALEYAIGLYRAVMMKRPQTMLEIGLANGASTLAILAALSELGGSRQLISVDPGQSQQWHNTGLNSLRANGFASLHRLIEEPDYVALPELLRQKLPLEAAYIDGWHTFDYVLLDFFYVDKLLPVGGIVGFNDCGWPALRRVLRFVKRYRKYTEIDVGLAPNYEGRNVVATLGRRVLNQVNNDRWFTKAENWEPDGVFYASF